MVSYKSFFFLLFLFRNTSTDNVCIDEIWWGDELIASRKVEEIVSDMEMSKGFFYLFLIRVIMLDIEKNRQLP